MVVALINDFTPLLKLRVKIFFWNFNSIGGIKFSSVELDK